MGEDLERGVNYSGDCVAAAIDAKLPREENGHRWTGRQVLTFSKEFVKQFYETVED